MTIYLAIGFFDGEVTDTTTSWMTSDALGTHFPLGDVYRYAMERDGYAWRILQRATKVDEHLSFYAQLLPIDAKDVPEIVRMVALMRE